MKEIWDKLVAGRFGKLGEGCIEKVLWLKEKEDIVDLRQKLQLASITLMCLIISANGSQAAGFGGSGE